MNTNELISVYIPTKNRPEMIRRAVESVLKQTHTDLEVIVQDDFSEICVWDEVRSLQALDPRVSVQRNSSTLGACGSRNAAIFRARGRFITGLDDDDEFLPTRLREFVENWDSRLSLLSTDFLNRFADGSERRQFNGVSAKIELASLLKVNTASGHVFTELSRLKGIGGFDRRVRRLQDWDAWIRLVHAFGDGLRMGACTYVAHHDHVPGSPRVSISVSYESALREHLDRLSSIYTEDARHDLLRQIAVLEGRYDLRDMLDDLWRKFDLGSFKQLLKSHRSRAVRKRSI